MRVRTRIHAIAVPALAAVAALSLSFGFAASAVAQSPSSASGLTGHRGIDREADFFATAARATAAHAQGKVDTSSLERQLATLEHSESLPAESVVAITQLVRANAVHVGSEVAVYEARQAAAVAKAARIAKERALLARANTPSGAKAVARSIAASKYGWGAGQFSCLESLWQKESGWNYKAYNPSGATGIPQALPGGKMSSAGADWRTNAATQITWGLRYIKGSYGSPCAAWGHSQATNWY